MQAGQPKPLCPAEGVVTGWVWVLCVFNGKQLDLFCLFVFCYCQGHQNSFISGVAESLFCSSKSINYCEKWSSHPSQSHWRMSEVAVLMFLFHSVWIVQTCHAQIVLNLAIPSILSKINSFSSNDYLTNKYFNKKDTKKKTSTPRQISVIGSVTQCCWYNRVDTLPKSQY